MAQARTSSSTSRQDSHRSSPAVIGAGARVRGKVSGEGDLTIEGQVEGEVVVRGQLFIAEGGRVVSDIDAAGLRVAGTLEGDVSVTGEVHILAGARVRGDLHGSSISLEEGAELDGSLDCEFSLPSELESGGGRAARR
jgi:cytoskeletal protein CcmA (bactofilin family)